MLTTLKYFASVLLYISLLPTSIPAALAVSAFTRAMEHKKPGGYSWGGWWGTYDNPPQGDEGFVKKRAPFPEVTTGFKGYINRVAWMRRNRLYGLKKLLSYTYDKKTVVSLKGNGAL